MRIPEGFRLAGAGVLVRSGYEEELTGWLERARRPAHAAPEAEGGRGGIARAELADGAHAYVRRYRHGGLLGGLLGEAYFGRPPRPWRELEATEAARHAGILAPEVLAAVVEPYGGAVFGVPYRGLLVTRAIDGRRSLRQALLDAGTAGEREGWLDAAVAAVRQLHACGVRHPDLNVTNLLVGDDPAEPVAVIDFDRASAGPASVGWIGRWLARRRLARSVAKLGLAGLSRAECRERLAPICGGDS